MPLIRSMKKLILTILTFYIALNVFAQSDDIPDYRDKRFWFKRLTEPDYRNDLASFTMGGIDESIGKKPLKKFALTELSSNLISFQENDVKVIIKSVPFEAAKHKLTYYTAEDNKKYVVRIDNKPFFGDYGSVPKTQIESVTVIFGYDTLSLPKEAFFDIYNPVFFFNQSGEQKTRNAVYLSNDGKKIYIYLIKEEEGVGSYEVTWIINDKKYIKRVIDFGFAGK